MFKYVGKKETRNRLRIDRDTAISRYTIIPPLSGISLSRRRNMTIFVAIFDAAHSIFIIFTNREKQHNCHNVAHRLQKSEVKIYVCVDFYYSKTIFTFLRPYVSLKRGLISKFWIVQKICVVFLRRVTLRAKNSHRNCTNEILTFLVPNYRTSQWRAPVNVSYFNEYDTYRNSVSYKRCARWFYVGWRCVIMKLVARTDSACLPVSILVKLLLLISKCQISVSKNRQLIPTAPTQS